MTNVQIREEAETTRPLMGPKALFMLAETEVGACFQEMLAETTTFRRVAAMTCFTCCNRWVMQFICIRPATSKEIASLSTWRPIAIQMDGGYL